MIPNSDLTISVWNRFWSPELVQGMAASGKRIHLIQTSQVISNLQNDSPCHMAKILLRLYFISKEPWFRKASMDCFEYEAYFRRRPTKCLWAWSGFNLKLVKWAKAQGIPVVIDTGGAHKAFFWRQLEDEHRQWGLPLPEEDAEGRMRKAIEEYTMADLIVMPSQFVKQTFLDEGVPEEKLIVNPYGVDPSLWSEAARNHTRRTDGRIVFIYGAGLTLRKGAHHLINAWKTAALKDAELWICGGGDLPLDRLCGDIPPTVKMLGFKTHVQMRDLYREAHVYVLPSMMEGLARSCIEAMAAGLPLIITRETGATDVMRDGVEGWVVPCRNSDALRDRLLWCANHREDVAQAGERAATTGAAYSFEAYGQRAAQILESLIGGPADQL